MSLGDTLTIEGNDGNSDSQQLRHVVTFLLPDNRSKAIVNASVYSRRSMSSALYERLESGTLTSQHQLPCNAEVKLIAVSIDVRNTSQPGHRILGADDGPSTFIIPTSSLLDFQSRPSVSK